jgi:hypothetical protein
MNKKRRNLVQCAQWVSFHVLILKFMQNVIIHNILHEISHTQDKIYIITIIKKRDKINLESKLFFVLHVS